MKLFDWPSRKTATAIADYKRDGFALVKNVLPVGVIAEAAESYRQMSKDIAEGRSPLVRTDRFVLGGFLPTPMDALPQRPEATEFARRILGDDVALYMNRLLVKDTIWNGTVSPHQDCPYFHGSIDKLSIFIPLEPFTNETGNLKFVAGSHRYGNLGVHGTIRIEDFPHLPVVSPEAYPGDIILATLTVWHYSDAPTKSCDRPMLQTVYQSAADGSYFGEPNSPRLVSGRWRTDAFIKFRDHIMS